MRYSLIRKMDISNGSGVGISLFVQGCHFHCQGCFNQETWDFNGGHEWTKKIEDKFLLLANKPYIQRISFLGGEPLADENVETILFIIKKLRLRYPIKKIWIYTGYKWEDIKNDVTRAGALRRSVINLSDVIVDGRFEIDKQDINHKQMLWAGSLNQRVIDVPKSLNAGGIILYKGEE